MNVLQKNYLGGKAALLLAVGLIGGMGVRAAAPEDVLAGNTDGVGGFYFKEIGGSVVDSMNENVVFEPASAIKVLIHFHGILQVENGSLDLLTTMVPWLADATKFDAMGNYVCGGNDCYADNGIPQLDTLRESLRLMMECSDNALTQALRDFLLDVNIDASAYGLVGLDPLVTQLNHSIGCGADAVADHSLFTLVEAGNLHEYVATSGVFSDANRQTFYDLMSNGRFFDFVIDEEAALMGLTADQIAAYKSLVEVATKGGSYGLSDGQYRSIAGWVKLPFTCEGGDREYVVGAFVDAATNLDLQGTGNNLSISSVAAEAMRSEIIASLDSFLCGQPPELDLPPTLVVECVGESGFPISDPAIAAWLASASASDLCGIASFVYSELPEFFPTSCNGFGTTITFTATDDCGKVTEGTAMVVVEDTEAPLVVAPAPLVLECNTLGGVDGNDPAIQAWYDQALFVDLCSHIPVSGHTAPGFFPANCAPGVPVEIVFSASDACGNSGEDVSTITVVDTAPPSVSCSVAVSNLWPANHKFVDVGLSIDVQDICDANPTVTVIVTSDEDPANEPGSGGGKHCVDAIIGDDNSVQLRAERSGAGDGRVYEITVVAVDNCGNQSSSSVQVAVPHSKKGSASDSGQSFDPTTCP